MTAPLVHSDRAYLASLIPVLRAYLSSNLGLELHPRKTQLQHYAKGARFLGAVIKPGRVYAGKRTKGNFYAAIATKNAVVADHRPDRAEREAFRACMNSYLGFLGHYDTRRLRRAMVAKYVTGWWAYAHVNGVVSKVALKRTASPG